jgi:prepilin-type N-terminal cleavage/methylation domain-containing protein/prepilin-type processing-associated H-X9-DG protein
MKHRARPSSGFTLIELLVVIAIIAILAAMLLPALTRAKGQGKKISCISNIHQLSLALRMYADDSQNCFPPHTYTNLWPSRIISYYKDVHLLVCPNDGPNPRTWGGGDPITFPADAAPRSYIYNGWNDAISDMVNGDTVIMPAYMRGDRPDLLVRDTSIPHPSDTVTLGEKMTTSTHFHMDLDEAGSAGGVGNDIFELERSRHSGNGIQNSGAGGSNYALADGSVRFIRFDSILFPLNLWAVSDANRVKYAVKP